MADKAHLDLLEKGVDAWNKWGREHPQTRPDLFEVDPIPLKEQQRVTESGLAGFSFCYPQALPADGESRSRMARLRRSTR